MLQLKLQFQWAAQTEEHQGFEELHYVISAMTVYIGTIESKRYRHGIRTTNNIVTQNRWQPTLLKPMAANASNFYLLHSFQSA